MKCITFTDSHGNPAVLWPAPSAQYGAESDSAFAARIMARDLPGGATGAAVIDAASYVPPAPAAAAVALQQLQASDAQMFRLLEALADVLLAKGVVAGSDFRADIRALYTARKALRTAAGVP